MVYFALLLTINRLYLHILILQIALRPFFQMVMRHYHVSLDFVVPACVQCILVDEMATDIVDLHLIARYRSIKLFGSSCSSQNFQSLFVSALSKRTVAKLVFRTVLIMMRLNDAFLLVLKLNDVLLLFFELFFVHLGIATFRHSLMEVSLTLLVFVDFRRSWNGDQIMLKDLIFLSIWLLIFVIVGGLVKMKFITGLRFITHQGLIHSVLSNLIEVVDIWIFRDLCDRQSPVNDNLWSFWLVVVVLRTWGSVDLSRDEVGVLLIGDLILLLVLMILGGFRVIADHGCVHLLWFHVVELIEVRLLFIWLIDLLLLRLLVLLFSLVQ